MERGRTIEEVSLEFSDFETSSEYPFVELPNILERCKAETTHGIVRDDIYHELDMASSDFKNKLFSYIGSLNDTQTKQYLKRFTLEEITMMDLSNMWSNRDLDEFIDGIPSLKLMKKIKLSNWHTRFHTFGWSAIKKLHHKITSINLGLGEDFEIRLDWTTGCNKCGYSEFTRTFLDGELAYVIYHKDEHVLTLSFDTYTSGDKVCVRFNQLQAVKRKGNRCLFKINKGNYFSYLLEKFHNHFADIEVHQLDPMVTINKSLETYKNSVERYTRMMLQSTEYRKEWQSDKDEFQNNFNFLWLNKDKIVKKYTSPINNIRRFRNGKMKHFVLKQIA